MKKSTTIQIQSLWKQGLFLHQNNDLSGAKSKYELILKLDPKHFDSLYLFSAIASQENNQDLAKNLLERAVMVRPNHIDALFNLAVILEKNGSNVEALEKYETINQLDHSHVKSRFNYASLLAKLGRIPNAINEFKKVIELQPNLIRAQENYQKLIWSQSQQIAVTPNNKNEFVQLHQKGLWLLEENNYKEAINYFDKALMLEPNSLEGNHNKGIALEKMGNLNEALKCYQKALQCHPNSSVTHNNLGNIYRELNLNDDAIKSLEKALELNPNYAEAYSNLGWTLYGIQEYQKSKECFVKALEINPNLTPAIFNLSLCQLILGEFDEGWINYEHRMKQPLYQNKLIHLVKPQWNGTQSIYGETIYVYAEQGLGDTIQFCRYIPLLAARGAKVLFEPQIQIHNLLIDLDGVKELLKPGQLTPSYDFHCPLMSLPLAFKTNMHSIPKKIPYLKPQKEKSDYWEKQLSAIKKPKVGLVWSGGFRPNNPELWAVNLRRNIPFELISQLNCNEIEFFSLQKGIEAEADLKIKKEQFWESANFHDFTEKLIDFSDTAALINQLDLVISVDTSTAHLAGAMGKNVWILNRYDACWRWLNKTETSDWYPTAKLFRQKKPGEWCDVINDVKDQLYKQLI